MDIPELTLHVAPRNGTEAEDARKGRSVKALRRKQLIVYLTPRKYLKGEELWKRVEMFERSLQSPIRLELVHDVGNRFDPRALGVFYDGVRVGYIRKRFYEREDTSRIEQFCFEEGVLREEVELYCEDHVLHLKLKEKKNHGSI